MCEIQNLGYEKCDGLCKICAEVDQGGEDVEEKHLHDDDNDEIIDDDMIIDDDDEDEIIDEDDDEDEMLLSP